MKKCVNCGKENDIINNFCPRCGYKFKDNTNDSHNVYKKSFIDELDEFSSCGQKMPLKFENELDSMVVNLAKRTVSDIKNIMKRMVKSGEIMNDNGKRYVHYNFFIHQTTTEISGGSKDLYDYLINIMSNESKEKYALRCYSDGSLYINLWTTPNNFKEISKFFQRNTILEIKQNRYTNLYFNTLKKEFKDNGINYSASVVIFDYQNNCYTYESIKHIRKEIDITEGLFDITEIINGSYNCSLSDSSWNYEVVVKTDILF